MTQSGANGSVNLTQQGHSGSVTVSQSAETNYNTVTVVQAGTGNVPGAAGPVTLAAAGPAPAGGLVDAGINVSQSGLSGNSAAVYQYSDYSGVSVNQSGTGRHRQ